MEGRDFCQEEIILDSFFNQKRKFLTSAFLLYICYTWLADGSKCASQDPAGNGFAYLGSLVYKYINGELQLESTGFGSGRIMVSEGSNGNVYTPNYFFTDHLSSTRVIYDGSPNAVHLDYLPFGTKWTGGQASTSRYNFTGYEDQDIFNARFMDAGARFFDGLRFTNIDPLAEKYYSISPYAYTANNPIKYIDPNGKWIVGIDGKKVTYSKLNGWSENAAADVQRVGNAMMKVETGRDRLYFMLNFDEKISITINPETRKDGAMLRYGVDNKKVNIDADGNINAEHNITIYEGSVKESIEWGGRLGKMDLEDAIGATAGHESGHIEKENTKQRIENATKGTNHDTEKRPREIELQMIKEYEELRKPF